MKTLRIAGVVFALLTMVSPFVRADDKKADEKTCDCAKDKDGKVCGKDKDCCCTGDKATCDKKN